MMDGYEKARDDAFNDQHQTVEEAFNHLEKIVEQYITDQTYIKIHQEEKPYNYVTLHVDQYFKDETGKFTETLIYKIPANGEETQENEKVWYQAGDLGSSPGDQAIYMLTNYSILSEKGLVGGEFENIYEWPGRYDIDDDTIQSAYGQKILESLQGYEQRSIAGNYTLYQ